MSSSPAHRAASPAAVWLALSAVYVIWGSTYLAIRVVVEADVPPLLAMGGRFLAAGALLAAVVAARSGTSALRVDRRGLGSSLAMGAMLLLGGNGLVAVAEQTVPSGLAALLVATTPLFLVLLQLVTGSRPRGATWAGVLVGFGGVALLALRGGGISGVQGWGVAVVVAATLSWAIGSFLSGRLALPGDPLVATVWEMLLGGVVLVVVGLVAGEGPALHLAAVPAKAWFAWAYLVTAGSMLGYTAYVWLLGHAPLSLVSTYAYVNPAVAVLLGWAVLAEPVTGIVLVGGALVVAGVALVVSAERPRRRRVRETEAAAQGETLPEPAA
ncbi:MAG TPA: EamA family transporter [Motilibacteraceae bacterium]|nr:EamA family transporter [Motilibacteraceae bacterium]